MNLKNILDESDWERLSGLANLPLNSHSSSGIASRNSRRSKSELWTEFRIGLMLKCWSLKLWSVENHIPSSSKSERCISLISHTPYNISTVGSKLARAAFPESWQALKPLRTELMSCIQLLLPPLTAFQLWVLVLLSHQKALAFIILLLILDHGTRIRVSFLVGA